MLSRGGVSGSDLGSNVSHCRILDDTNLNWVSSAPAAILLVCNSVFTVWIMVVREENACTGCGRKEGKGSLIFFL